MSSARARPAGPTPAMRKRVRRRYASERRFRGARLRRGRPVGAVPRLPALSTWRPRASAASATTKPRCRSISPSPTCSSIPATLRGPDAAADGRRRRPRGRDLEGRDRRLRPAAADMFGDAAVSGLTDAIVANPDMLNGTRDAVAAGRQQDRHRGQGRRRRRERAAGRRAQAAARAAPHASTRRS